jgi:TP901 family phage tail tape measure protein
MGQQIGFNELFNKASFDQGVSELVTVLSKITEEIKQAETAGKGLAQALGTQLKKDIAALSASSKTLSKEMADITAKMDNFKATNVKITQTTKEYEKEVERLNKELEKLKNTQSQVNTENEKASKTTSSAKNSFSQMSQALLGVAAGAALVHRGITILKDQLVKAVQSTLEFEVAMKGVQAVSRSTEAELELLTANANKLGATTEKTAGQVANLQMELAKLGFDPTEIIAATQSIVDLSTATGEDLVKSGIVAAATLRAFGLEATEMSRVTDVMTGSFVRSGLDLEKFRESMKLVAPIAKATGVEIEVTTAALSKLADTGISGSLAGTALRNLFSSMADPTEDLTKLLGKLDSSLKGGIKSSDDFSRALIALKKSNIDLETAVQMVDVRARSAFFTLVDQAEAIEGLTLEYKILNGETQEIARVMRDTLANDLEIATSAFDALRRNIVEQFVPAGRDLAQNLTILSEYFRFLVTDIGNASREADKFFSTIEKNYGIFQPFVDLWNTFMRNAEETVVFRRGEEAMAQLGIELDRSGISLKTLNEQLFLFDKTTKMIQSGKTADIMSMLTEAGSEYSDILVALKAGTFSNEEATKAYNFRLKESLQTTKEQFNLHKKAHQQLLKDIKTNETFREVEKQKLGDALLLSEDQLTEEQKISKKKIDMVSQELFDMKRKEEAYRKFFASYTEEEKLLEQIKTAKKGAFDPSLLEGEKEKIRQKNKELEESLKLQQQIAEAELKRQLQTLQLQAKVEKDPIKQLELQRQIFEKQKQILDSKYGYELQILEKVYKEDVNYSLKRKKLTEDYFTNLAKLGDDFLLDQFGFQDTATKNLTKAVEDATKKGHEELKKLAKKRLAEKKKEDDAEVENEKAKWERIQKTADIAAEGLSRITRFVFDNRQLARENEFNAIDAWEQERIRMAGDNEEAIGAIEKEAEERRRRLRIKEAQDAKKEAIFQILIDTARGVMATIGQKGVLGIPLAAIVGAFGAAQAAIVAARPLPQFEKGTNYSPEGRAIVGEAGSELIIDGRTKQARLSPDRASITHLSKGSQVIPAHITQKLLTDPNFDYNGVAEKYLNKSTVIKVEKEKNDFDMLAKRVEQAITNIPINQTNFDERGVTNYVVKRNVRMRRLNKRY